VSDEVHLPGHRPGDNLALDALARVPRGNGVGRAPVARDDRQAHPVAAGMAGGSADAAATLRLVAQHAGLGDPAVLHAVAAGLGADVPAQLRPGRALATGAGERVEPLEAPAPPYGVLVLPSNRGLSTAAVFAEADRLGLARDAAALAERQALVRAGLPDLPTSLSVNELEPAARSLRPDIDQAFEEARGAGAQHVLLSGSGPTVLGFFHDPHGAQAAADRLNGAPGEATAGGRSSAGAGRRPAAIAAATLEGSPAPAGRAHAAP
jgi:4-diphosphocytidyl-2-C-methyl-D-erythritol kinase